MVVGSVNPVKVAAVRSVFGRTHPGLAVRAEALPSGVSEQPIGFEETHEGAANRAWAALDRPGAAWGVGLEGGVALGERGRGWLYGVAVVAHAGFDAASRSASLRLPDHVARRLTAGETLGTVLAELAPEQGHEGALGWLSGGLLSAQSLWEQTLTLALVPLLRAGPYAPRN